jgi:two-component system, NtrC family, response regulator HydG
MPYKLLLVDDDRENLAVNKALLSAAGYQISVALSGDQAIKAVRSSRRDFALILMDVAFSLDDTREVMRENFKAGVIDFLDKNAENDTLLSSVAGYCAKYDQLYRTLDDDDLDVGDKEQFILDLGMVGRSDKLFELARQIRKVGPTQATTLILGESGTGKELVARALHRASDRAKAPIVAINIAAEPASLLDSTLFGHKKGAFTGAVGDQAGKFLQANKGTIFLDEIGDMSLDLQVKLLRVLQEREVTPLGSTRSIPVDVRIVAATHRDLQKMVVDGTFREDLYYRLNTVTLTTTPLRLRTEDIEPLVISFTKEICERNRFNRAFHRRCLEVFRDYPWKGNVRELRSVVESHLIACDSDVVMPENLDHRLYQKYDSENPQTLEEIDAHLDGLKKQMVLDTLKNSGTRAEAARKLDIPPNRLHYFITKWGLGDI